MTGADVQLVDDYGMSPSAQTIEHVMEDKLHRQLDLLEQH
jgi:hypothetical protein